MTVSTNQLTSATVDIPSAAKLLGVNRKTAYSMAQAGGTMPTVQAGTRKLVPKGWLCDQLHLNIEQLNSVLAGLSKKDVN